MDVVELTEEFKYRKKKGGKKEKRSTQIKSVDLILTLKKEGVQNPHKVHRELSFFI